MLPAASVRDFLAAALTQRTLQPKPHAEESVNSQYPSAALAQENHHGLYSRFGTTDGTSRGSRLNLELGSEFYSPLRRDLEVGRR